MDWSYFIYFAAPALLCWIGGAWLAYRPSFSKGAVAWTVFGLVIFSAFIVGMWISLERPPLRTMGETRLWYSFFLPVAGVITYVRWRYKWILSFSTLLAFVFICVNLFKPEIHNKTLMPALQSPWFAPHVIVYMFSYAMLGAAALIAIYLLIRARKKGIDEGMMSLCDNLVYVGMAFLTIGMLFGALWAKEAWGHYWNWDPKWKSHCLWKGAFHIEEAGTSGAEKKDRNGIPAVQPAGIQDGVPQYCASADPCKDSEGGDRQEG